MADYPKLPEDSHLDTLTLEEILQVATDFKKVIIFEEEILSQLKYFATSKRGLLEAVTEQYIEDNQVKNF